MADRRCTDGTNAGDTSLPCLSIYNSHPRFGPNNSDSQPLEGPHTTISNLAPLRMLRWFCFILLSATAVDVRAVENGEIIFSSCEISQYYVSLLNKNISTWTRTDLETLMQETHGRILPYTDSDQDGVWKSLIDLDAGDSGEDTVRLIYRAIDFPATPHGDPSTWNREHLWPKSLGVDNSGADFTDIHHLRPSDWNVNAARNNKFFGECGLVEDVSICTNPATPAAANDTASDPSVFFPPLINRGEIARALFYMDVRYSGNDGGLDLQLTDCPSATDNGNGENEMAYLSQLLEWHQLFPPSERERQRNTRACERWQGNRNVFVDFPSLVELVFGKAQSPLGGGLGCACDSAQSLPTPSPTNGQAPNGSNHNSVSMSCASLSPGAVMVVALNSDDPDLVAMVALDDLPGGMLLYMTDNAWTGTGFRTNEGTLKMTIPSGGGIPKGTMFGYGSSSDLQYASLWQSTAGSFSLAAAGDTVIIYCTNNEDDDYEVANIRHLSAFSYSGNWAKSGLSEDEYGTDSSSLPESLLLTGAATALPHLDNYMYDGTTSGTRSTLLGAIVQSGLWIGSNNERYYSTELSRVSFEVKQSSSSRKTRPTWLALGVMVFWLYVLV